MYDRLSKDPATLSLSGDVAMKFFQTYPGHIMAVGFVTAGIMFMLLVSFGEKSSGLAGRGFDGGKIDGSGWQATEFPEN